MNRDGSGDMYPKGGNMLHTIRQVIDNDEKWREILRGLQQDVPAPDRDRPARWRTTSTSKSGIDLTKVFEQYLTTTQVPVLEYRIEGATLSYRWTNVVPNFSLPIRVTLSDTGYTVIRPTESWQSAKLSLQNPDGFMVDPNYYVESKKVTGM